MEATKLESLKHHGVGTTVYLYNIDFDRCPICGIKLEYATLNILSSERQRIQYVCRSCGKHRFIFPNEGFLSVLEYNPFSKDICINYTYYFRQFNSAKLLFEQNENYSLMLLLRSYSDQRERYVIISNETDRSRDMIKILSYKEKETRQILTDIYKKERTSIELDGKKYEVCKMVYRNKYFSSGLEVMVPEIMIKPNGGYYQSLINNRHELVDVLLYSPFTGRYELARATYNKDRREYFMDINAYRRFYREYGNPGLSIYAEGKQRRGAGGFCDLRDESLLHAFGYNVNAQENLGSASRQCLLADIIDLELMSQKSVIALLESLIKRFTAAKYNEARLKWQQDLNFVIDYKANPQRFIIANP